MSKHLITEFGQEEWSKAFNSREWKAMKGVFGLKIMILDIYLGI